VAPVRRLLVLLSLGRTELLVLVGERTGRLRVLSGLARAFFATSWRSAFREVKYSADPKPVRSADGRVPRHSEVKGCGPERMERRTGSKEEDRDCWTRVFKRSAGCRRTALEMPEARPARKWNVGCEDLREGELVGGGGG
jgi:hypothetical protein